MDKLQELQDLQNNYLRSRGDSFRCSICNCVSDESIETNIGDYRSGMSFVNDPKDHNHFICVDCSEEIQSLRNDYSFMDEFRDFDN